MYVGRHVKYPYSCQVLMKLEFYRQVFEKYIKMSCKSVLWEPSCSMRTDRQGEAKQSLIAILQTRLKGFKNSDPKSQKTLWLRYKDQSVNVSWAHAFCLYESNI